jgi:predicted DNA-binding WGR domain protein
MPSLKPQYLSHDFIKPIHMHRTDPTRNMARFYQISIEASLFGDWTVVRRWGRIGSRGRTQLEFCENVGEASIRIEQIVHAKHRRGYRIIT